jgi:ankyrin repeat protein
MAIKQNRPDLVKLLLDAGASPEGGDLEETGLAMAIRHDNLPILQMLLEGGADPNMGMEDDYRAIMSAAFYGRLEMVKLLVAYGADVNAWSQGETAIMSAASNAHQAVYDYLYPLLDAETRRYADKHGQKEIARAIKRKAREANKIQEKLGDAALYGKLAKVQQLLSEGADPNAITECGKSPLMLAAMYGHKSVLEALLDAGADPNLGSDEQFEEGTTALMYIASSFFASNRAEVIKLLVDRGADLNAQNDKGQTALLLALQNTDAVKASIEAGADLNLRDNNGNSAMMLGTWAVQRLLRQAGASEEGLNDVALVDAARQGNLTKIEELLHSGANVNYSDGSALVAAAQKGHLAIVDRLIQAGADVNLGWKSGFTPIAAAAYSGYLDVVERLLSAGANPFQRTHDDEYDDALDYARRGQAEGHHKGKDYAAIIELFGQQPHSNS